jgi:hypothetical protein
VSPSTLTSDSLPVWPRRTGGIFTVGIAATLVIRRDSKPRPA